MDYTYSNITTFANKRCHICNDIIKGECSTNIINNGTGPLKIQFFHIKCRKKDAYKALEQTCLEHDGIHIDYEQTWESWVAEQCEKEQVNAQNSLKPQVLEGVAYSLEYVDAVTIVLTRCR